MKIAAVLSVLTIRRRIIVARKKVGFREGGIKNYEVDGIKSSGNNYCQCLLVCIHCALPRVFRWKLQLLAEGSNLPRIGSHCEWVDRRPLGEMGAQVASAYVPSVPES